MGAFVASHGGGWRLGQVAVAPCRLRLGPRSSLRVIVSLGGRLGNAAARLRNNMVGQDRGMNWALGRDYMRD